MARHHHRPALVAGTFYADDPERLKQSIEECCLHPLGAGRLPVAADGPRDVVGLVCPHAGYLYSGPIATRSYCRLAEDGVPEIVVILAPAHFRPIGDFAVWTEGFWETPFGEVSVDESIAVALMESHPAIQANDLPHVGFPPYRPEHAIEVQLPFLQLIYAERTPRIVPIAVSSHDFGVLWDAGTAMGGELKQQNAVVIASCDMTHYEPHDVAEQRDRQALERIAALDAEGLMRLIETHTSLSDTLIVVTMLAACRVMGATGGEILGHATSGDVIPDRDNVVGYGAAAIVKRET